MSWGDPRSIDLLYVIDLQAHPRIVFSAVVLVTARPRRTVRLRCTGASVLDDGAVSSRRRRSRQSEGGAQPSRRPLAVLRHKRGNVPFRAVRLHSDFCPAIQISTDT